MLAEVMQDLASLCCQYLCRAVRTRRFQSMSKQDICQYVIIGLLTGCFWFQRGGKDTLSATQDTLGAHCA